MKNKLTDLNNHLFAQLERLGDESMSGKQLEVEAMRAKAIVEISDQIVQAQALTLRAVDIVAKHGDRFKRELPMLPSEQKTIDASLLTLPADK